MKTLKDAKVGETITKGVQIYVRKVAPWATPWS